MKHCKRISHKITLHSRELFERLGIPGYEHDIYNLDVNVSKRKRSDEKGNYFYLNISFTTKVTDEDIDRS